MKLLKSVCDRVAAAVLLVFAAPVLIAASAAIALDDGFPVTFRQSRAGRGGRRFELVKLRTMRRHDLSVADLGLVTAAHPLITSVGRFLRRTKIDELPQLLNVLAGEMSFVGPRPTVEEQVAAYDEFQRRRLAVAPGLTGLAQVSGGIALNWDERILLDIWYIDHWSPALDLRILWRTLSVIVRGERRDERALQEAKDHALRTYGRR